MQNSESHTLNSNDEVVMRRTSTKTIGDRAEDMALAFLERHGYRLLDRNFRYKRLGEIDLVMRHGQTVVFVEVRYRASKYFGSPEASITSTKRHKLRRTAQAYLLTHGMVHQECRFDVVAIDLVGGEPVIRHLVNCM